MQTPGPTNRKRIRGMHIWASRHEDGKPNVTRKVCMYMRRVYGRKVTAQYPGRSVRLSERTKTVERRCDECTEVSRGHSSSANQERRPELNESERKP